MIQPLSSPNAVPIASAATKANEMEPVTTITEASTTDASVSTAPMERSRPSVMMIRVIGSASSSRIDDCTRMFDRLGTVEKPGLKLAKIENSTTSTNATPGMRPSNDIPRPKTRSVIVHAQFENIFFGQPVALQLAGDAAFAHHISPIADIDDLAEFGADHQNGRAGFD